MANDGSGPVILVGWEGSARGRDALVLGRFLALDEGARLVVVYAHPDYSHFPLAWEASEEISRAVEQVLASIPAELVQGVEVEARAASGYSPAEVLQQEAARCGAATIVVGSTHHGPIGRVVPGSVGVNLLHGAPCDVAVAPVGHAEREHAALESVAAAFDGSAESEAAVRRAAEIAAGARAKLRVLSAIEPVGYGWAGAGWAYVDLVSDRRDYLETQIAELADTLPAGVELETRIREGAPAHELLAELARDVDLIVIGSRGYGPVRRVLLGSVSANVIRHAPCPVLVVPRGTVPGRDEPAEAAARAPERA